jgi:3'-5' exonuclease
LNNKIKQLNINDILFFDCEMVRRNKELVIGSEEHFLFREKERDRTTDEYLDDEILIDLYQRKAALKPAFNKIVCISIGAMKDDVLNIKSFYGDDEKKLVEDFYKVVKPPKTPYTSVCGWNIKGFDLPMTRFASLRHGVNPVNHSFNDSGKKPWELPGVVDLMEDIKGTYFTPFSLNEVCYMLDIPSPKSDLISGSMVSDIYYEGGIEEIQKYCKRDVLAVVNVFKKLRGEELFEDFIDRDASV